MGQYLDFHYGEDFPPLSPSPRLVPLPSSCLAVPDAPLCPELQPGWEKLPAAWLVPANAGIQLA